MVITDHAAEL